MHFYCFIKTWTEIRDDSFQLVGLLKRYQRRKFSRQFGEFYHSRWCFLLFLRFITLKFHFSCFDRRNAYKKTYTSTKNILPAFMALCMPHSLCIVKPRGFIFIHTARCRHQSKMFLFCFLPSASWFLIIAYKFIFFSLSSLFVPFYSPPNSSRLSLNIFFSF